MTDYFTAHETLEKVEGLHSLSTLNKWANFIQKECSYTFRYDYIRFASHTRKKRTINHRKTRVFSTDEIQRFQQVVSLIPTLGRDKALRQLFDKNHRFNQLNHVELMAEMTKQVEARWMREQETLQELFKYVQQVERTCSILEQRIHHLEEKLSTQEDTSSGWFRWKR